VNERLRFIGAFFVSGSEPSPSLSERTGTKKWLCNSLAFILTLGAYLDHAVIQYVPQRMKALDDQSGAFLFQEASQAQA